MRIWSKRTFLAVALSAGVLAAACNRDGTPPQSQSGQSSAERQAAVQPAPQPNLAAQPSSPPQTNELRPEPQSVVVEKTPPSAAAERARQEEDLAARERRLAERQAALDARERRLQGKRPQRPRQNAQNTAPQEPLTPSGQDNAPLAPVPAAAPGAGEPANAASAAPLDEPREERPPAAPMTVPSGTSFDVEFTRGLASNTSSVGDTFRARVVADIAGPDGLVAIPAGSEILGVVTDAVALGRVGGRAKLGLKFTDLVLPSGSTAPLHVSFVQEGKSKTGRDAATIGGSTAGGAILGHILSNGGRGSVIGALIGAAVGTAIAAKTPGEEVVIPEGSVLKLKLDDAVLVSPLRP
ncbi:MAG TPA: hypothetical protein VHR45_16160 [Thermoanaerobaculia bacterium]|nr:hypothetical protein [Thermoanaerobaculia bacterium]